MGTPSKVTSQAPANENSGSLPQNISPPTIPSPPPDQLKASVSNPKAGPTSVSGAPTSISPSPAISQSKQGNLAKITINNRPFMRIPDDPSIEWYKTYYQTAGRQHFKVWLARSTKYLPFIKSVFRREGLPEDLAYLSLIESGFSPRAYSYSRASGLWQFMSWTGKKYGLKVNWWIDQRRDPVQSTYAAARYLKDLYNEFHSWSLALAAYNAGEGKVANAVAETGTKDYWEIRNTDALSNETKDYVPKYLAAMKIAKDPSRYGLGDIDYDDPLDFETVYVHHPTEVRTLAKSAGVTMSTFREYNPEFIRWATPPHVASIPVNIPKGAKDEFQARLSSLPELSHGETLSESGVGNHKIRSGDSLWTISRHYGVSVHALMEANNITSKSILRPGKKLIIPPVEASSSHLGKYYSHHGWVRHRIRKGESLFVLAKKFRTTISAIRIKNHLSRNFLRAGQTIMVPLR